MNAAPRHLPVLAGLLLGTAAFAQTPVDPPPWWRVNDDVTVSLYWNFDTPFAPGTFPPPSFAVVPPWYSPTVTTGVASANLRYLAALGGNVGVLALQGSGAAQAATLDLTVDNDPYIDWIKVFWFQFDAFEGTGGSITAEIEKSLAYDRAIVSQQTVSLGNGWERVTIEAQLIPQPDDEGIDWSFLSSGNTVAIDNLFVNSKCVKPQPDQTGDAFGAVSGRRNLTLATGGLDCRAAAITEGPAPTFVRRTWISTRATTAAAQHQLLQVNALGQVVGSTSLPFTAGIAPGGAMDLAVETVPVAPIGSQQYVYALVDGRQTVGGNVVLVAVDANTGLLAPARNVVLNGFPPLPAQTANFGLAFDPSGDLGAGTFWVSDQAGNAYEFRRSNGALLTTASFGGGTTDVTGLGYDDTLGRFYGFSRQVQPTPTTPVRASGFEWSGYDLQRTGNRFCGDLTLPNGAGPRGGLAGGLEVFRSRATPTSQLTMVCIVDTPNNPNGQQWLYEVAGPFGFGWSLLGRCGMRDTGPFRGLPFVGNTLEVTLTGVPDTLFASLFLGFSNTSSPAGPLPLPLSTLLGWQESVLSVSPDVNTGLLLPTTPGTFVFPIAIPASAALGYQSIFCQWLCLDAGVPGFFAMSQAGKTVLYP